MTGSVGNSEFCFPWTSLRFSGKQISLSLLGLVVKHFNIIFPSNFMVFFFIAIIFLHGLCMVTCFLFELGFICFISVHHSVLAYKGAAHLQHGSLDQTCM